MQGGRDGPLPVNVKINEIGINSFINLHESFDSDDPHPDPPPP